MFVSGVHHIRIHWIQVHIVPDEGLRIVGQFGRCLYGRIRTIASLAVNRGDIFSVKRGLDSGGGLCHRR